MTDLHPVKIETFQTRERVNIDPKGHPRFVDVFHEEPWGLYMARGADHPRFGYLESWLLPSLGLRVNKFHTRPAAEHLYDLYIDIVHIGRQNDVWVTRDLYVDLIYRVGEHIAVDDIDELAAATSAGYIAADDAEWAIERTLGAVEGIARHNDDVEAWLRSMGAPLTWAGHVTLADAAS